MRGRRGSEWADHQPFAGHCHYLRGDRRQLIDLDDTLDLCEQSLDQSEVATRDARDCGHHVAVSGTARLKAQAELVPMPLNYGVQFLTAQRPEVMHEADARVQLRVSRQLFL